MTTASSRKPSVAKPAPDDKGRQDKLLDEALKETFPASDTPSILQPAPDRRKAVEK